MQRPCSLCYLKYIEKTGSCFFRYTPELPKADDLKDLDLRVQVAILEKSKEVLEDFIAWKEKMIAMMDQALKAAEQGDIFYHPCTGCPEWPY